MVNAGSLISRMKASRGFNAFAWTTSAFVIGQVLRVASNLIATRLLAPEMFGVVGLVLVVQMALALMTDVGVRTLVVQSNNGDKPEFLNTVWTLEILRGGLLWLISLLLALALWMAASKGWLLPNSTWAAPQVPPVLAAMTFGFVISGFQSTRLMLATRNLEAKQVATVELLAQILGLVVMIGLAWATGSIWSLVASGLAAHTFTTLASHYWIKGQPNHLQWDHQTLREIIRSGRWLLLSSLIYVVANSADRIFLASYLAPTELGLYVLAFNLVLLFELLAARVFSSVALPTLSAVARDNRDDFAKRLMRLRLPIDLGLMFAAGALYAEAHAIIDVLFDPRYAAAGDMLQLLSFYLIFVRFGLFNMAYVALDKADVMAKVHVVKLVSILLALPLAYYTFGFTGALIAVAFYGLVPAAYMLWQNRNLGLNDWRHEGLALLAWPVGYGVGLLGIAVLNGLHRLIT
jgi:O-antigen/teichoic acid export membrane protein